MIGKLLDISNEKIQKGIKEFELTKKRIDILKIKSATIINDSYNASYESMKASIEYLSKLDSKRKIAVLGDMFELGDYTEELHRKVGEEIVKNNINILICCGKNSKYIVDESLHLGMESSNIYYLNNIKEIANKLNEIIKPSDAILIKASNGMRFFDIVEQMQKND